MSDEGILEGVMAELVTLLKGGDEASGAGVYESLSLEDLALLDAEGQLPAYGVIYRGYSEVVDRPAPSRKYYAITLWEIGVVARDESSGGAARRGALACLTLARDRVHFAKSAYDPQTRYLATSEEVQKLDQERVGAVLMVRLKLALGN